MGVVGGYRAKGHGSVGRGKQCSIGKGGGLVVGVRDKVRWQTSTTGIIFLIVPWEN